MDESDLHMQMERMLNERLIETRQERDAFRNAFLRLVEGDEPDWENPILIKAMDDIT